MNAIKKTFTKITFLTVLAFSSHVCIAVSFDCNKASMPSEKIVCSNPALSKLDDQMFAAYSKAKSESANPDSLKNEQILWIKEVRTCGNDDNCISSLYTKRISQLTSTTSPISEKTEQIIQATKDQTAEIAPKTEAQASTESPALAPTAPQEVEQKNEQPQKEIAKSDIKSDVTKQAYVPTRTETAVGYSVGILLYILSFLLYVKKPKFRKLSISTPFDLGCKNELSEAEQAVKGKKQWIEFGLLLLSIIVFLFILSSGLESKTGILNAISSSLLAFLASLSLVVVGRLIAGWATSCPKCKSAFARKCINSYTEPKGTFEKVSNGVSGSRNVQFVKVMETGVRHADYLCTVCSHEWHEATQYTKQLSEHMRG